ncbi:MAG: hypothetical protein HY320_06275 [Armatimonadetes bacterium]|nr:hypothetical protein [Armatimonadota bacterium]
MSIFDSESTHPGSEEETPAVPEPAPREGSGLQLVVSHVLVAIFAAAVALGVSKAVSFKSGDTIGANQTLPSFPRGLEMLNSPGVVPGLGGTDRSGLGGMGLRRPGLGVNSPGGIGSHPPGGLQIEPGLGLNRPGPGGGMPAFAGANFPGGPEVKPGKAWYMGNQPGGNLPGLNSPHGNAPGINAPLVQMPYMDIMDTVMPTTPPTSRRLDPARLKIKRREPREPSSVRDALAKAAEMARNQGPEHAARYLERWTSEGNVQSARVFAMAGTLWLKVGDKDRAYEWFDRAAKALVPPSSELTPPDNTPAPIPPPEEHSPD